MIFKHLVCTTAIFFGIFNASAASAQTLATVGSKTITLEEFKKKYDEVKKASINAPSPELFLEDLIRYEVGAQEAEKQGFQNDPLVKERFRQEMYKALVEKALGEKVNAIKVTEPELKKYYAANPEMRISHILIEFKAEATPQEKAEAKKRANEILAEVKKSKREFSELVKLYSDDIGTKNMGGDLGFHTRQTIMPTIYDLIAKMKVGEISGPAETRFGFHIVKLTERHSYDDALGKQQIRAGVFNEKRAELFHAYFKALKAKYKIDVNKGGLKGFKAE